ALMNIGLWEDSGWGAQDRYYHHGYEGDSFDDFTYGLFLGAGFDMVAHHGRIGIDLRAVVGTPKAQIDYPYGITTAKGDYIQISMTFGFGI
ncbi:MAG: hypothetical protein OEV92_10475, partial [Nitrospinota bacterium]|nr:hypothetical protein [Nitrospinota bacterium]